MTTKITGAMCVDALCLHRPNLMRASEIAALLKTDSRAVATALRKPVKDGRVKWGKFVNGVATYKYLRSTPTKPKGGAA